jgi:PAP2 superfamily
MKLRNLHFWISLLLIGALTQILRHLHLPLRFDWIKLSIAYWFVLAAQSIFMAAILFVIGIAGRDAQRDFVERWQREPMRLLLLLFYFGILGWAFGGVKALVLTVDTIAVLEFRERGNLTKLGRDASAVFLPALYFFVGFLLVLAYNCIIVSVRFNFAYDPAFNAMDRWILHGSTVFELSRWAVRTLPIAFFHFLEFIYFGMFPQIGAGIIVVGLYDGRGRSLQFVGTLLMAYYVALGLFYLWPSQGPYYMCPDHFAEFPSTLQAYSIQKLLISDAKALWSHVPLHRISTDYFIAFPCMHIAQPLIVIWFLRRWKVIVLALCAYDAILIVAILLLEWHYLVDILGGMAVAAAAIAISENSSWRSQRSGKDSGAPVPGEALSAL